MSSPGEDLEQPVLTRWIGRVNGVAAPLEAPRHFVLAGVDWQGPELARVELRARLVSGMWTPWVPASGLGHDGRGAEAIAHALVGEPVWTGPAKAVQLRSSMPLEDVNVHLVLAAAVVGTQPDRAAGRADTHPEGAAPTAGTQRDSGVVVAAARPGQARADTAAAQPGQASAATAAAQPGQARADTAAAQPGQASAATAAAQPGQARAAAADGLPLAEPNLPAGPGQPAIIARHAWAGGLLPRAAPYYGDIRLAFIHHSVNANGYSSAQVPAMLRSIYYFHTYVRGWNDIGYNFAVDAFGRIWEARAGGIDRPVVGAQAGGYNVESFGAVLLGDFAATLPSAAARAALARLIAWKLSLHGVPASGRVTVEVDPSDARYTRFRPGQRVSLPRIAAHRDGCTTDCPGSDMYVNGMPALRASAAGLVAGRLHGLTLEVGAGKGSAYALSPYAIAPGTKVRQARYLELETVTMTAGLQLPLHGALRSFAGTPVRSATIALQNITATRHSVGDTELARAITGPDGAWAAVLSPHANMLLRALHADAPASVSALIVLGVAPQLSLGPIWESGGAIHLLGSVTPIKRHVMLEVTSANAKHRVVLRKLLTPYEDGGFDATLRLAPGRYWVTARTSADALNIAGASQPSAVRV